MAGPTIPQAETSDAVRVRLPRALKDLASAHARVMGMTDAEYYRHCVRAHLGFYRDPAALPVAVATPDDLRRRAAFGDAAAQTELARRYHAVALVEPNKILLRSQLAVATTFALMAVEHGSGEANRTLGALQLTVSDLHRADVAEGTISDEDHPDTFAMNGLAHIDLAADLGDAPAAEQVHGIAETLAPHVVTGAALLRESWRVEA